MMVAALADEGERRARDDASARIRNNGALSTLEIHLSSTNLALELNKHQDSLNNGKTSNC